MTPQEFRRIRISLGFTQAEFAKHLQVTIRAIGRWEAAVGTKNHRRIPGPVAVLLNIMVDLDRLRLVDTMGNDPAANS